MNSKRKTQNSKQENGSYKPLEIESKWQAVWEREKIYSPNLDKAKKPFYNLMMFPYLSAEGMHVGNMYAFTGADVYGRFMRMRGNDVFEPIGLDGFGIHSENYAIKVGKHPVEQAKVSESNFYRQLKSIGNSFDWSRTLETYKPEYYKWTQWLFIQLFKAGLAYRKKAPVNFCPSCKTVLADEQVLDGKCERCNSVVEKRDLEQWFFAITKYADRLLNNIEKLDWSEKVKIAQKEWIGRSEGVLIRFKIKDLRLKNEDIEVFTTRPDTLFGATFLALSPEHPIIALLLKLLLKGEFKAARRPLAKLNSYIEYSRRKTEQERVAEDKEKTGVFTGLYAINPVNNEKIPVWVADYVLMDFGTGALFGDAHDERDVEFAKKYRIPLKPTLRTGDPEKDERIKNLEECFTGYGMLFDSGKFSGLTSKEAITKITSWLEGKDMGRKETTYHLRDWLISRQRYWGPPIPMIWCQNCANQGKSWFSEYSENSENQKVRKSDTSDNQKLRSTESSEFSGMAGWFPEDQLPVELPFIEDYKPLGTGKAPLASHPEFYETKCPNCGGPAKRETDVSDTFLDSSWYFLRYLATEFDDIPFPINKKMLKWIRQAHHQHDIGGRKRWLPVAMYIGGAEHSVLHLLYSRFITMVLKDLKFINFEEPFAKFRAHGLIIKDGVKMSKSKGNVVIPDEYIRKFGADALRTYLMFTGPFNMGADFRDSGIEGMSRFLKRIWTLVRNKKDSMEAKNDSNRSLLGSNEAYVFMNKTIKRVKEDIENLKYNTAIAALMEYYNFLSKQEYIAIAEFKTFLKLLASFAPHIAEELWKYVGGKFSIHQELFPKFNENALRAFHRTTIAIQINGKLRDTVIVTDQASRNRNIIEQLARKSDKIKKHLERTTIKKVIYVEGKVLNFVTV